MMQPLEIITRRTQLLQHLQVILDDRKSDVTLADAVAFVQAMQEQYGSTTTLEEVIQSLVGLHIRAQIHARQQQRLGVLT